MRFSPDDPCYVRYWDGPNGPRWAPGTVVALKEERFDLYIVNVTFPANGPIEVIVCPEHMRTLEEQAAHMLAQ